MRRGLNSNSQVSNGAVYIYRIKTWLLQKILMERIIWLVNSMIILPKADFKINLVKASHRKVWLSMISIFKMQFNRATHHLSRKRLQLQETLYKRYLPKLVNRWVWVSVKWLSSRVSLPILKKGSSIPLWIWTNSMVFLWMSWWRNLRILSRKWTKNMMITRCSFLARLGHKTKHSKRNPTLKTNRVDWIKVKFK